MLFLYCPIPISIDIQSESQSLLGVISHTDRAFQSELPLHTKINSVSVPKDSQRSLVISVVNLSHATLSKVGKVASKGPTV